ncbi:glycosyltransferase family 4 protein [Sphingomonas sp. BIUV-7]|uniref:Glycosyltransferase family 4 protein n=2 Tax=Sphingomonas natans TaxID=3063330 RepID=A0ABT8Y4A8_9SPHN|nr:glycosyltransferase family 4 protein [Sphingomonas sp. BIUV-7]MDO6413155.1 glycosyltransferase family 4 protein [Sphingomonas sp. BIUV-7]
MDDPGSAHAYGPEVVCSIAQEELADYVQAARRINESGADVIIVQHEYGIFGGPAGALLLKLLDRVDAPVVVTLHTVLENPNAEQRSVIEALARRAFKLIVMAEKGVEILQAVHGIGGDQVAIVPHGVPDRPFLPTQTLKPAFGFDGHRVLLTFGLLSPNKGIETMIRALPRIVAAHPDVLYVILGATHPHLVAREGEAYRDSLASLAAELGVSEHVRFIDGFLDQERLLDYLQATDVYVTPYLSPTQITSGTLSYAVALGKPVVSTPYWHAAELLADGIGRLVPFEDVDGFAAAISDLLDQPALIEQMSEAAYAIGRTMTWDNLARAYLRICADAVTRRPVRLARPAATAVRTHDVHPPKLDAIERMSDGCGMLQHSIFSVPDRDHGYCVDDNCRALMLMHRIDGPIERADELARIYASFVQHAWNGDKGRFRNFMAFDRGWLEDEGSEDSFGRSLWTIGATVAEARHQDLRQWGLHLFNQVAPHSLALMSPRTWAFALLGAEAVLEAHPDHAVALRLVEEFSDRLWRRLRLGRREGWIWFEAVLAYDNARLPEALMLGGRRLGNKVMLDDATAAFEWLDGQQTNAAGQFRAVGTDSFWRAYEAPLPFDQQPLEAWATVDAALVAHDITGDARWLETARRAYAWYLGDNDLGLPMATPADGGCYDGLMSNRVNLNQGAESILAYQFACAAMTRAAARNRTGGQDAPTKFGSIIPQIRAPR